MASQVRISDRASKTLRVIAEASGRSMQSVLDEALEAYRRQMLLEAANEGFAKLRSNPEAWREETEERRSWEATLLDGQADR
jgi:hypothetical protein